VGGPDGLTIIGATLFNKRRGSNFEVDTDDVNRSKLITTWQTGMGLVMG